MSKELEALERLKNTLLAESYWQDVLQDVAIIETTLKRNIELEKENLILSIKEKALEIIKRNPIMIICEIYKCVIELEMSYEEYCNYFPDEEDRNIKSKEEYYLLKEVLL